GGLWIRGYAGALYRSGVWHRAISAAPGGGGVGEPVWRLQGQTHFAGCDVGSVGGEGGCGSDRGGDTVQSGCAFAGVVQSSDYAGDGRWTAGVAGLDGGGGSVPDA